MIKSKDVATIQDVARVAGVSVSTVSRVLNNKDDVARLTYARVQKVIADLNYTSSLAAKSMRSRKTNVIGLIVPDISGSFSIEIMKGVNQALTQLNYDLIMYTCGGNSTKAWASREQKYVSLLNGSITDGVIIVAPTALTFPTTSPIVAVDHHPGIIEFPAVIANNWDGATTVMNYLLELGHRRIGFIGGRSDLQSSVRRYQGYVDSLQQAGISFDSILVEDGNFTKDSGYAAGRRLLNLEKRPSAIFATNDESAIGVIKAAQDMGLKIPDDLSVVGFDNTPESAYYPPLTGLTTVDQGLHQMGAVATEMLVKLIEGTELAQQVVKVPTNLVIRGSCKAI